MIAHRPRRLRDHARLRETFAETNIGLQNLMLPIFVTEAADDAPIDAMPGVMRRTVDSLCNEVERLLPLGVAQFMLFGVPDTKSADAIEATQENSIVPRAVRALRQRVGQAAFISTDVCLCSYTSSGHCGLTTSNSATVQNDKSVQRLGQVALAHAQAGADMVAPSDMMDGRIGHIRSTLDGQGFSHLPIMSYAVKYASSLYGPFRHAADSAPQFGDRRAYQMDIRNRREALREALLDVQEGADILLVKPGIAYLDIVHDLYANTTLPIAAYQVSGEYAMLRFAAMAGAIDEPAATLELWTAMRRAGAQLILTYHAAMAADLRWLS